MRVLMMQFGSDIVRGEGNVIFEIISAEIVEIDGGMGFIFDFDDGVVGRQRLRYLMTILRPIRGLKRTVVLGRPHHRIIPLIDFDFSELAFGENRRSYEFDSRR